MDGKSACVFQVLSLHSKLFGKGFGASNFFAAHYASPLSVLENGLAIEL